MNRFDDIKLQWEGKNFTIPSRAVMGAIARIEDVITLQELQAATQRRSVPLAKLSMAYAAILRYAGADVQDEDVYAGMFEERGQERAMEAVIGLLRLMLPQTNVEEALRRAEEAAASGNVSAAARVSSRRRSKRRSAKGG